MLLDVKIGVVASILKPWSKQKHSWCWHKGKSWTVCSIPVMINMLVSVIDAERLINGGAFIHELYRASSVSRYVADGQQPAGRQKRKHLWGYSRLWGKVIQTGMSYREEAPAQTRDTLKRSIGWPGKGLMFSQISGVPLPTIDKQKKMAGWFVLLF